jgi:hypothetical protein
MEDIAIICVAAVAIPLAMIVADLAGMCMGFGWGHYSRKLRAKNARKEAASND